MLCRRPESVGLWDIAFSWLPCFLLGAAEREGGRPHECTRDPGRCHGVAEATHS
jgi:hypothetical protein